MSEPRRILTDSSATPFERDLLESWSSEQPSASARARALAIAGAAAGTLAAATAATATASTTGAGTAAGAAGAGAPTATGVGMAVAMKWGILFVVAASAVASIAVLARSRTEDGAPAVAPTVAATVAPAVPTAALPSTPTAAPPVIEPKTVSPADLPPASPTAAVTAAAVVPSAANAGTTAAPHAGAAAAAPGDSSLSEEIASFDRARAALDAGDADRALVLVDAYEKRFPAGTFVQEAEVLRVQALARKGDTAGARRAGQRFLAAHPTSPHAARIRAILDASNP